MSPPWSDVEWTSLDTVEETPLDTMQGNLDYLRDITDRKILATGALVTAGEEFAVGPQSAGTSAVRLIAPSLGLALGPVTLNNPSSGLVLAQQLAYAIPSSVTKGGVRRDALNLEWRYDGGSPWFFAGVVGTLVWSRGVDVEYLDSEVYIEAVAQHRLDGTVDASYLTVRFASLRITGTRT